ncbi:hypothetical protein ACLMJV_31795 [Sinorhizobium meliloti]|uniref:hypothetical protein n=1 Tax=Rhizobium meliloti TaxID=382 RepID=UPI00398CD57A
MQPLKIAFELEEAEAPSRRLDAQIATFAGWKRKVYRLEGHDRIGVLWLLPGETESRLPEFTKSVDAAFEFVSIILPGQSFGVAWLPKHEKTEYHAVFENGDKAVGCTAAIAICAAALKARAAIS